RSALSPRSLTGVREALRLRPHEPPPARGRPGVAALDAPRLQARRPLRRADPPHERPPFPARPRGQSYLREGERAVWRYDDLQSFTPLRFLPPELMGHRGRALVVDPD